MTMSEFRYMKRIWLQLYVCKSNMGRRSTQIIPLEVTHEVRVLGFDVLASDNGSVCVCVCVCLFIYLQGTWNG